jgi:hypothetical protein
MAGADAKYEELDELLAGSMPSFMPTDLQDSMLGCHDSDSSWRDLVDRPEIPCSLPQPEKAPANLPSLGIKGPDLVKILACLQRPPVIRYLPWKPLVLCVSSQMH